MSEKPRLEPLTADDWLQIIGLLANIQTRRMKLTRHGEEMELTPEEEIAFAKARHLWAAGELR